MIQMVWNKINIIDGRSKLIETKNSTYSIFCLFSYYIRMSKKDLLPDPAYMAIILFIGLYIAIIYGFPQLVFEEDGSIRQFGIGFRKKTIFPIWLFSIVLGILSYVAIQYHYMRPKLMF